jgi:hypothetical protein
MGDNERRWSVEGVLTRLTEPLKTTGLLTISKDARAKDEAQWRVIPVNPDATKIVVRVFAASAELFLGEVEGPFEIDYNDPRDRLEFEQVLNAVLSGEIEWELARTLVGPRITRLIWPTGSWTLARPMGLNLITFGKRRIGSVAYGHTSETNR